MEAGNHPVLKLSKLSVGERQLKEAIWMFFARRDPVATHTVACAAHEVLRNVGQKRGIKGLKDNPYIRPGMEKSFLRIVNSAQNFFKHADKDPDATFDFPPDSTVLHILDAVHLLMQLKAAHFPEGVVFASWACIRYPKVFHDGPIKTCAEAIAARGHSWRDLELFRGWVEMAVNMAGEPGNH